jgi:hypothetical protein
MAGDQADEPEAFDRKVGGVLDAEADATSVLSEITLQLAVSLAWLDE